MENLLYAAATCMRKAALNEEIKNYILNNDVPLRLLKRAAACNSIISNGSDAALSLDLSHILFVYPHYGISNDLFTAVNDIVNPRNNIILK